MLKEIIKAYKLRIYPSEEQEILINKTFGCCRFVYNFCRGQQKKEEDMWKLVNEMVAQGYFSENNYEGKFFNKNENIKYITELKQTYEWLKEVDNTSLQCSVENLAKAYDKYYKKQGKLPKFKSKRNTVQSYTCKWNKTSRGGTIRIENDCIVIPKVGKLKFSKGDRLRPEGQIINATISKTNSNKYYISLTCKVNIKEKKKTYQNIGIDLGLKVFCTMSNGKIVENHKFLNKGLKKISKLQKALSRKTKDSANWIKNKLKLAEAYEKIANQRYDFLQKLSTKLINNYDVICMEDLKVSNMLKNKKLSKAISDAGWGMFKTMLKYKAGWYGKTIKEVNTFYASSQICNICGYKNIIVKNLKIRLWECPNCHKLHDRDYNASINILNEGLLTV